MALMVKKSLVVPTLAAALMSGFAAGALAEGDADDNRGRPKLPTVNHEVFSKFAGQWKGQGVLRTSGTADKETVRCRLKSTVIFDGRFLFQDGTCSAVGRTVSFLTTLGYDKIDQQYAGTWINSINVDISTMKGTREEANLSFALTHDSDDKDKKVESTMTMTWLDRDQYRLVMTSPDPQTGEPYERSNVVFKRR
ncbi:MAG: DUF1579 family protein [Hyphomicrobiales bacterium]